MDLSSDVFLALAGFLLLIGGAVVFWWMDRRSEVEDVHEPMIELLNALPHAVLALRSVRGSNGAITELRCSYLNAAGERLLGVRAVDVIGHSLRKKLSALAGVEHYAAYTAFLDHGIPPDRHVRTFMKDTERWLERCAGRHGDGLVLLLSDVTDNLRNGRVQRMEERLSTVRDAARTAVHEMRNPLTALALVEDQLRVELQDLPDAAPHLDMIRRNVDRLRELTDAMVEVNRTLELETKPVQVGALVRQVVNALAQRAGVRQVQLRTRSDGSVAIPADGPLLRVALEHLSSTVIDLAGTGDHVDFSVEARAVEVVLSISLTAMKGDPELAGRVMRQAYRPLPVGAHPPLGHVHGILLAHATVLEMEGPRAGRISWRIAFPLASKAD